jgi:ketose-bisphosphate aldolase
MLVHIKDIVQKAITERYTIGAFNIHGLESIVGVIKAAQIAKSPAIIQVSESTIKYIGLKSIVSLVTENLKKIAPEVPIALHIDHGSTEESVFACIDAGFSSVHIDGSKFFLTENIALTKRVIEVAHSKGVWVQGEVGPMMGGHGNIAGILENIAIAELNDVVKFVEETKVDTIAAAIGTAHGVYQNEDIIIPLLKEIKEKTKIPFVLHGGSGVAQEKIIESIKEGVNIINIGSDIKIAFCQTLVENCRQNPQETDPRTMLNPTIEAIKNVVIEQIKLFGSNNKI